MIARKLLAPVLGGLLLLAVAAGIWRSHQDAQQPTATTALRSVRGLIGSEKQAFFDDPRVQQLFAQAGLVVHTDKAGSRDMARHPELKSYDFGFPAGAPAAQQLRQARPATQVYQPFYTPMVLASWRPIADTLQANQLLRTHNGHYELHNLPGLLALMAKGARWRELKNNPAYATGKSVLIQSTDVRSSNSAAMYLALLSYVANGEQVVQSQAEVDAVMPVLAPLFLRQGFQDATSASPFEDYLALGMGKTPLLVTYESQLIEFWWHHPDRRQGDMVLIYPRPTVYSKHVLVPWTPAGQQLGLLLESSAALRALAHEYGFRTGGEHKGPSTWAAQGLKVPEVLDDVIDPPSPEWLERMIETIESRFR